MNNMSPRKFACPEIIFGEGVINLVGQYAEKLGATRVLLVTDPGVIRHGISRLVSEVLAAKNISHTIFDKISPNPRDHEVADGVSVFKKEKCDFIIAVGGGSPVDCAKGIGIVVSNGGSILDYEGVDRVSVPIPPIICIPTTSGAAADLSQFAIINNTKASVKIAIISKAIIPDVALIDPVPLMQMEPYLTACTGIDAMTHAIEAYVSLGASAVTDIHAVEAIKIIKSNIINAVSPDRKLEDMYSMMLGCMEAGLAFSNASLGAVHAMAHSLGGLFDMPHGECNSVLLPDVVYYNYESAADKYNNVLSILGYNVDKDNVKNRETLYRALVDLIEKAGIKPGLHSRGVKDGDIGSLAVNAANDPCLITNPKKLSVKDLESVYARAL